MAGNSDIQRKLNQGVEAAKSGDRATARRLLEEVVGQDDRNELAWIWLATVAINANERRDYLRRVLEINPRNQRAREALSRLGDESTLRPSDIGGGRPANLTSGLPRRRSGMTGLIFVIAALALLLAGVGIILFGSGALNPSVPTPTATRRVSAQINATVLPSETPLPLPSTTPIPIDLITRSAPTLPATITPTVTPTTTPTPQVTPPLELGTFDIFYTSQDPAVAEPALYAVRADGSDDGLIAERMRDFTFAPDGQNFAFVRDVLGEDGSSTVSEIFVGDLADPNAARPITQTGALDTSSPTFSPDGQYIIFSSSGTGSAPDLWVVGVDGAGIQRITNTDFAEFDPAWSPLGDKIVYSAEFAGDGTTELFFLSVTAAGEPVGSAMQATDAASSSYSPAWSPDGSTVVFASDRRGDGDIYTMDAAGANEQLVTIDDGGAEDQSPSYSADGRWIVFISNREDASFQTYVMRDTGAEMRRITSSFRIDQSAVFRPRSLDPN